MRKEIPLIESTFDHLHFKSSDPDAMCKFLVDHFGGVQTFRRELSIGLTIGVMLAGQSLLISGNRSGDKVEIDSSVRRYGLDHWGLQVKDLDAAYVELTANGVQFALPPSQLGSVKFAFVLGPDNSQIELVQRG